MASKADKNGLIMCAVGVGCLIQLRDNKIFASIPLNDMISEGIEAGITAVIDWPGATTEQERTSMQKTVEEWGVFLDDYKTQDWRGILYISLAMHTLTDLTEITSNRKKLSLISPILNIVETLHNSLDPEGRYFIAMEHADVLLDELYKEIEFIR